LDNQAVVCLYVGVQAVHREEGVTKIVDSGGNASTLRRQACCSGFLHRDEQALCYQAAPA
jgi:hypothetical protein